MIAQSATMSPWRRAASRGWSCSEYSCPPCLGVGESPSAVATRGAGYRTWWDGCGRPAFLSDVRRVYNAGCSEVEPPTHAGRRPGAAFTFGEAKVRPNPSC